MTPRVPPLVLEPVTERSLVGVEQELRLWRGATQVDFRPLLGEIAGNLVARDPGDPRARRLPSGLALTADGQEAELATPPWPGEGDVAVRLGGALDAERDRLADAVAPAGVDRITGFSTHVNVTVPDRHAVSLGLRFVQRCAVAVSVLTEPRDTLGIFVRPRRGRLEVGTEYVEGPDLHRAVTFTLSAVAALRHDDVPVPARRPAYQPAREKFGWHLPASGLTLDVLTDPRLARDLLSGTWSHVRPHATRLDLDPSGIDDLLAGNAMLPSETGDRPSSDASDRTWDGLPRTDHGPRSLADGVQAHTAWLTWELVAWVFQRGSRQLFAVMHVDQEPEFLAHLDAGRYRDLLARELRRRVGRRRLISRAQADLPGWWHRLRPEALVAAERPLLIDESSD